MARLVEQPPSNFDLVHFVHYLNCETIPHYPQLSWDLCQSSWWVMLVWRHLVTYVRLLIKYYENEITSVTLFVSIVGTVMMQQFSVCARVLINKVDGMELWLWVFHLLMKTSTKPQIQLKHCTHRTVHWSSILNCIHLSLACMDQKLGNRWIS